MKTTKCKTNKTVDELSKMLVHKNSVIKEKDEIIKGCKILMHMAKVPQLFIDNPASIINQELTSDDFIWAADELAKHKETKSSSSRIKAKKA